MALIRYLLIALISAVATPAVAATPDLLPAPQSLRTGDGELRLPRRLTIVAPAADPAARNAADRLVELLRLSGRKAIVADSSAPSTIRLVRKPGFATEGYRLSVDRDGMEIAASDDSGLLYGAVTLWQLAAQANSIPALTIEDAPRFTWRGLMLDSARHFQSPDFVRKLIDWMAVNKLNRLHWHLVDDQAWRIEILKYPELTRVSAWRIPATAPGAPPPPAVGGFYRQSEIRAIVEYARQRGIVIVPEIEMPGHATSAIRARPSLGMGVPLPDGVWSDWGVFPWLYRPNEDTFAFLENVLGEVIDLFPSPWIHVGGDEADKSQWRADPSVQAQIRKLGLKDENALQGWFTARIGDYLARRGRRLLGWDEILDGGVPADATVMSWRGIDGAVAAVNAGHDAILSPSPTLYFDNRQGTSEIEPPGRGTLVTLEDVYRFDPLPAAIGPAQRKHLLGVQGNLWTEHVRTEDRAAWMMFPRALAVAELGWSAPGRKDYPDFLRRAEAQLRRMQPLDLTAATSAFAPAIPLAPDARRRTSRELETCSAGILLDLEDDYPASGPRAHFLTDISNPCWLWRNAPLEDARRISLSVGQIPFNFQIGAARDKIRFDTPRTPAGEFEVRSGDCAGPVVAVLPLAPAVANPGVTRLSAPFEAQDKRTTLCIRYTARGPDPMWALDVAELEAR